MPTTVKYEIMKLAIRALAGDCPDPDAKGVGRQSQFQAPEGLRHFPGNVAKTKKLCVCIIITSSDDGGSGVVRRIGLHPRTWLITCCSCVGSCVVRSYLFRRSHNTIPSPLRSAEDGLAGWLASGARIFIGGMDFGTQF